MYRTAAPGPEEPKVSMFRKIKDFLIEDLYPANLIVAILALLLGVGSVLGYAVHHASLAHAAHAEHDRYWLMSDRCVARSGWYVPSEDYYGGLIACRRLDDHRIFYLVPETGLALIPMED